VTRAEIERDIKRLFSGNFREWVGLTKEEETEQVENNDAVATR
jgi:hypothetical protein